MKVVGLVLGLSFVLMLMVQPVWAQTSEREQMQQLEEVVVTATRAKDNVNEIALKIITIDKQDIELSNASTVDQLLFEKNIGHMHSYPGSLTQVSIRGFRSPGESAGFSSPILFLIDGRRAGTSNLAKIPVEIIERIEIIKGASSAVYGAEAVGGVINLITKQGNGNISGSLIAEGGSASRMRFAAEAEGTVGGLDFFGLGGRSDKRADYRDGCNDVYENTQSRGRDYFVNLGYSSGEHRLGASVLSVDGWDIGNPGSKSYPSLDDYSSKDMRSFDIRYDGAFSVKGLEWMARYYQVEDTDIFTDPEMVNGYRDSVFDTDTYGAQFQLAWTSGISRLIIGFDWDKQEARNAQLPSGRPYGVNADYVRSGIYVAEKLSLFNDRLLLNMGLRYDNYDLETKSTQGYDTLKPQDEDIGEWIPRIGMVFAATDSLRFKASVGRGVLLPTAAELAGDFINSGWYQDTQGNWQSYELHYLGNNELDPEQSWTYEVGGDYTTDSWNINASMFYTDYSDKIVDDPYFDEASGESISSYANTDGATINGVEVEVGADLAHLFGSSWSIEPFASITYLFEMEDEDTDEDLLYVSDTQARFGMKTVSPAGFMARILGIYHGPQDVMKWNRFPAELEETGGFTVWNISVSQKLSLPWRDGMVLTFFGGIDNILDKYYAYVDDYPMPGRQYRAGMKLTF
jgi:vitamin B12 transporter